jgi:salicylate hydroxylase
VLIGDAAHASLPYLAQGAAMALEDACVLSGLLKNSSDIPSAFQDFSKLRFGRTAAIQKRSRQLGKIYHATGVLRQARNAFLKATPTRRFTPRLSWIYNWRQQDE